jgi:hypothetical protein
MDTWKIEVVQNPKLRFSLIASPNHQDKLTTEQNVLLASKRLPILPQAGECAQPLQA